MQHAHPTPACAHLSCTLEYRNRRHPHAPHTRPMGAPNTARETSYQRHNQTERWPMAMGWQWASSGLAAAVSCERRRGRGRLRLSLSWETLGTRVYGFSARKWRRRGGAGRGARGGAGRRGAAEYFGFVERKRRMPEVSDFLRTILPPSLSRPSGPSSDVPVAEARPRFAMARHASALQCTRIMAV